MKVARDQNGGYLQGGPISGAGQPIDEHKSRPLGKYVTQLEMKNPEARKRYRQMLDFQIN